jgi:hypothetical protein
MRCTTRTATHSIVALRTWSAYQRLRIARWRGSQAARTSRIWIPFDLWLPSGIAPRPVALGTGRMLSAPAPCSQGSRRHLASFMASVNARFAAKPSSAGTPGAFCAATPAPAVAVYNLTVEGAHCYYANGVLVHNCDTVTMALAYFRDKHIFQTADDELSEEELKDVLMEKADTRKGPRNLYGGRDSNRSTLAGSKRELDLDDIERMTPTTRRKLYSDWS